ncbi:hypothetical protein SDC9_127102 [bioreactor metagenome]|uniref:Uncharacterized protein n=1 Tax=bioreactor metagenome TaxID=1076179 RepID=A0A645CT01_9ZZZZ
MVEFENPGRHPVEEVTVVSHQQTAAAIGGEKFFDPADRLDVEMVGRLVQQQQIRLGNDRPRQSDPAFFTAGKIADPGFRARDPQLVHHRCKLRLRMPGVVQGQQMFDLRMFGGSGALFIAAQQFVNIVLPFAYDLDRPALFRQGEFLIQRGDPEISGRGDPGLVGDELSLHDPEQRRFAAAVAADQRQAFAFMHRHGRLSEDHLTADIQIEVADRPEHPFRHDSFPVAVLNWNS